MIYGDRSFYVIRNFEPVTHVSMGRYYFSVGIEKELAKKAVEYELNEKQFERLKKIGVKRIEDTGLLKKDDKFSSPYGYRFHNNEKGKITLLLSGVSVPGDACDLSFDWKDVERLKEESSYDKFLGYYPHNIDSTIQAYTLLSLWLTWAETVKAICE